MAAASLLVPAGEPWGDGLAAVHMLFTGCIRTEFRYVSLHSSHIRSAPSMPRSSGPSVRNYNYYSAPPLISSYGGYGFGMPFFGGGIVAPFPLFGIGSLFNIILVMFVINIVLQTVRGFTSGGSRKDDDEDDRWD